MRGLEANFKYSMGMVAYLFGTWCIRLLWGCPLLPQQMSSARAKEL